MTAATREYRNKPQAIKRKIAESISDQRFISTSPNSRIPANDKIDTKPVIVATNIAAHAPARDAAFASSIESTLGQNMFLLFDI